MQQSSRIFDDIKKSNDKHDLIQDVCELTKNKDPTVENDGYREALGWRFYTQFPRKCYH